MSPASYRIASVLVRSSSRTGANYFRNKNHGGNLKERLQFLLECATAVRKETGQILVLPAGFFCVVSSRERQVLEREVLAALTDSDLLIAFGIDETGIGGKKKQTKSSTRSSGNYPFFGYVIEKGRILLGPVRQTGVRTDEVDKDRVQEEIHHRLARSDLLGGATIALAICGELLSVAWRDALADQKPNLVLHPAHASVQLGGTASESWRRKLNNLIQRLPRTSAWGFSDHVMQLEHWAGNNREPLVRRGKGAAAEEVTTRCIGHYQTTGRMYIYKV